MSEAQRGPGRPKNTGRHQANDAQLLAKIADNKLMHPHQPLATIIRKYIDPERDTGGVRRLQRGFQAQGHQLLAAAAERHRQQQLQGFADGVFRFAKGAVLARDTIAEKLSAWAISPEGQQALRFADSLQRFANSPEACKWAELAGRPGNLPGLPYRL